MTDSYYPTSDSNNQLSTPSNLIPPHSQDRYGPSSCLSSLIINSIPHQLESHQNARKQGKPSRFQTFCEYAPLLHFQHILQLLNLFVCEF